MDVRLSPEQAALRDSAAQVVDRLGPRTVAGLDDHDRSLRLDRAVAAAGWRDLRSGTDDGRPWASAVEAAIVAEELGRGLADTAFVGPILAAELRRMVGAAPAEGAETVALDARLLGLAGATGGPDEVPVAVDVAGCGSALVSTGDGLGVTGLAEVRVAVDLTRPLAGLDPGGVAAPVGGRPLAGHEVARWTALGLALTSADLVGTMRGAIRLACDHAAARKQYGVAVGSFQAVQHLLADAFVAMEGSRSVTLHAAWAIDALPPADALAAALVAKAYSARAARDVCETAIQVHGGLGNTWECPAHVFLRRALLSSDLFGGAGTSLGRVLGHHGIGGGDGLR